MINPAGIPQFTGDFDQLERDVSALRSDAIGIRNGGADVHSRFQMLGAYYTAPEAEDLFASTRPVLDGADGFAAKLETVADALDTYAIEARPLAERLERLKAEALTFTADVEGDDDWTEDEAKVQRNQQLIDDVTAAQAAFQDAERRAASRITALVGGPAFVADDGSGVHARNTVPYGYEPGLLEGAEELPWGTAEEQTYDPWSLDWFGHGAKSFFYDGVYKDGIEAAARGMWDLVTLDGDAWSGLGDVVTGIGLYTLTPYDAFMDWAIGPDEESADEQRAKTAARDFGKALVAWDQWEENPARAVGTVVFNALTLGAGPLGAASKAGKGGLAARSAGAAAKAGLLLDPVYVGLRAGGTAFSKLPTLSELASRIVPAAADAQRVHSFVELQDGSRLLIEDGRFIPVAREKVTAGSQTAEVGVGARDSMAVHVGSGSSGAPEPRASLGDEIAAPARTSPASGREASYSGGAGSPSAHVDTDLVHGDHLGGGAHGGTAGTGHGEHSGGGVPHHVDGSVPPNAQEPRVNEPLPALTPEQKVAHSAHLGEVEKRSLDDFDDMQRDPDKNGGISEPSKDEARVGLDLREQGRLPSDIRRPTEADRGEFYSPSTGRYYDIKGVHSDWPPFNNVRDKSQPFRGAYNPTKNAKWVSKLSEQIVDKGRIVILDVRNANQAAIDDIRSIIEANGWTSDVIWYP